MSETENTFARIRELEQEVKALTIVYRKTKTYYNAVKLQHRQRERLTLIRDLRKRIHVVSDNSELWEALA